VAGEQHQRREKSAEKGRKEVQKRIPKKEKREKPICGHRM